MHKVRYIHVWDEAELYDVKSIDGNNFRPDGKSDRVSFVTVTRQHLRSTRPPPPSPSKPDDNNDENSAQCVFE